MSETVSPRAATARFTTHESHESHESLTHNSARSARGGRRVATRRAPPASAPPASAAPAAVAAAQEPLAELLRAGHAQLAERLVEIERALSEAAAQLESATSRRALSATRGQAQRAGDLLASLAALVALPATPLRLAQVEVSDLLILTLSRWKTRAPERTFELALPGHEPTLLGDGALIAQALEGLIAWAAAYAGPGDIRVSLRQAAASMAASMPSSGADDVVMVSVRAPLPAGPAPQPERLFARVATPQADGAGAIELALARAIAERHGGHAWAEINPVEQALALSLALPPTPVASANAAASLGDDEADASGSGAAPALARTRSVIVVAHGDARMARYLRANLEAAGYSAKAATTLETALQQIELEEPDLALLDLALPASEQGERGERGRGAERRDPLARALGRTMAPIIALGPGADPAVCVAALDAGAADFIAQPLSVEETLARVRRALHPRRGQPTEARQRVYTCGDLTIDDAQRSVALAGAPVALSKTEYRLLRALAQNPGKTLAHETLLAQVWGPAYSHEIEFVWVYIRRLRRKIEPDPAHPRYILTAPGIGYRLAAPAARPPQTGG